MRPKSRSFPSPGAVGAGLALLLALAAPPHAAADEAARHVHDVERVLPDPGDPPGVTAFAPTRRAGSAAFAGRLRAVHTAHERALAALRERLAAAGRAERPAVQREIESLKRAHLAELVAEQLARARAFGHEEVAVRLERRLASLRAPAPPARPAGGGR